MSSGHRGRDGLEALSMEAVASFLCLTTMSLYRHVDSRQRFSSLLLDGLAATS